MGVVCIMALRAMHYGQGIDNTQHLYNIMTLMRYRHEASEAKSLITLDMGYQSYPRVRLTHSTRSDPPPPAHGGGRACVGTPIHILSGLFSVLQPPEAVSKNFVELPRG